MADNRPRFPEFAGLFQSLRLCYCHPIQSRRMVRFYKPFVARGGLCFDLGAHVGSRVRTWLKLGARVLAVEPQPACAAVLHLIYGSNPDVAIEEVGIGAHPGSAELHISTWSPRISTLSEGWIGTISQAEKFRKVRWDRTTPVTMRTLDDLIAEYGTPGFCKIDVEGNELDALEGLSVPVESLSFEYVLPRLDLAAGCINRLQCLANYEYNWSFGERFVFDLPEWVSGSRMKEILNTAPESFRAGDIYARRI